jgi:PTH1 family peptidyl-tRNA hydrolase
LKIIFGLGNPGREYEATRHNVGWWALDHLADVWHFDRWRKDGDSLVTQGMLGLHRVRLVKPQTYMNLSGQALKNFLRRPFWSAAKDLLVIVDDVALPVGRIRLRPRGGAGGHNGLRNIEFVLDSIEYCRLRIGVGPSEERKGIYKDLADFVLSPFAKDERETVLGLLPRIADASDMWVRHGIERAMNEYNREDTPQIDDE